MRARILVAAITVTAAACANVAGLTGGGLDNSDASADSDAGDATASADGGVGSADGGSDASDAGDAFDAPNEGSDGQGIGDGAASTDSADAADAAADAPQDAPTYDATTFATDVPGNGNMRSLVISGGYLYWVFRGIPGHIRRAPLAGGPIETVGTSNIPEILLVNAPYVYWIDLDVGILERAPLDGGATTPLASATAYPAGFVLDGNTLVWGDRVSGQVGAVLIDGGSPRTVTTVSSLNQVTADNGTVYIAVGAGGADGGILQVPIDGGTATPLTGGLDQPQNITVTPTTLYVTGGWSSYYARTVNRSTGATTRLDTGNALQFTGYQAPTLDATYVYTSSYPGMARIPRAGGAPEFFSPAGISVVSFALDPSGLYWIQGTGEDILRATPVGALWQ